MPTVTLYDSKGAPFLISAEDFERVWSQRWRTKSRGYLTTWVGNYRTEKTVSLHRFIANPPEHMFVDHINMDVRDNRRENLRVCSRSQNSHNRKNYASNLSGLKGVGFHASTGKWRARIAVDGKQIHLGLFGCREDAHAAYVAAARRLHGEFARTA